MIGRRPHIPAVPCSVTGCGHQVVVVVHLRPAHPGVQFGFHGGACRCHLDEITTAACRQVQAANGLLDDSEMTEVDLDVRAIATEWKR